MRTIARSPSPACLTGQPPTQDWFAFMRTACHGQIRVSLSQEQLGLCCYCEMELKDGEGHIEHMEPRGVNPGRCYDYTNLAISCDGGSVEHCGRYKEDRHQNREYRWDSTLFSPPHDPNTSALFRYTTDGSVVPAPGADPARAAYGLGYLGLNCARLVERRRQHAHRLVDTLGEQPKPDILDWLRNDHLAAGEDGRLKPFHSLSKAILQP